MTNKRLLELKDIIKNPIDNIISRLLKKIYFCGIMFLLQVENLIKGYYHGIVEFDKEYPMKPPKIKMFTLRKI